MYKIDPTRYIQRTHTWFTLEEAQEERAEAKKLYKHCMPSIITKMYSLKSHFILQNLLNLAVN